LWCLLFLLVTQVVPVIPILIIAIAVFLLRAPNVQEGLNRLHQPAATHEIQEMTLTPSIVMAQLLAIGFSLLVIRLVVGREWKRRLALRRPAFHHLVLALLLLPSMTILSSAAYEVVKQYVWSFESMGLPSLEQLMESFSEWPLWFGVLVIGLGPGIGEELWCRGFLGRGLVGRFGYLGGVLLTSMFFGLLHANPPHVVAAALMGVILHFAYLTTRSLWVPITVHFLNNSLAVVATTKQLPEGSALKALDTASNQHPLVFVAAACVLLAAVGWALFRSRPRFVPIAEGVPPWQPLYPGVEIPPPDRDVAMVLPPIGLPALVLVGLAIAVYGAAVTWAVLSH
jgi:membrane protease YdiL (CAAX protease family)